MPGPFLVTARLSGLLADGAPKLDSLLEMKLSLFHPKGVPGYKIDRSIPAPRMGEIPIPIARQWLGNQSGEWLVAKCSDPILAVPEMETVEYVNKRLGVENAGLLAPANRLVVSTSDSWTKSYRIPLRIRKVSAVSWFAFGDRKETLKVLRRVHAIGKKTSDGYGRVSSWEAEWVDEDCSWFAPSEAGSVLMSALPLGDHLPDDLIGWRRDFGAVCPPYWHGDRYCKIVAPA